MSNIRSKIQSYFRIFLIIIHGFIAACTPVLPPAAGLSPDTPSPAAPSPSQQLKPGYDHTPIKDELTPTRQAAGTTPTIPTPVKNRRVGEETEYHIGVLLPRDGIRPVHDPQFASAAAVNLRDGELVMGLYLRGEAKAYPVSVLRFREMVNDEIAGWPVLVTW